MSASQVRAAALVIGLVALCFLQSPGLITADTKLDLVTDPGGLVAQGLLAWTPEGQFGQVQNQAYGYLWPMGPFFWLGQALGLPGWVVQRLWWAAGLVLGFLGMRLLLRRLGIGGPDGALVGALAFALAPRVLGLLGTTSVEAWPTMVLPWIMLPLVGRRSPWAAAALSGAAMLLLGGVNAAASLAVLLVPLLWLLLATGLDRRPLRLGLWLVAVVAATSWWFLPLLSLRSSAYPFLDYIESAQVTSAVTSVLTVLRGAQHWVAYTGTAAGPTWTAGFELALRPGLVLATALVAALGLLGLAWRGTRVAQHRFLLASLATGLLVMSTGYAGSFGSPLAGVVQDLLDDQLAPFRNIHKFDALVRLPLAAGLAHLVAIRHTVAPTAWGARRSVRVGTALTGALVLVGGAAAGPFLAGRAASRGAFEAVPAHWVAASRWLDAHAPEGRVLILPSANFGQFEWGSPLDEPLPTLTDAGWVLRNAVPLGAPGAIRWMDGVDALVRSGRGSADLAPALAAAGVTHVLLRADLSPVPVRTPAAVARAAIVGSPGLRPVAEFGPRASGFFDDRAVTGAGAPRDIEIFEVTGAVTRGVSVADPLTVAAGPEAAATHGLASAGVGTWVAAADTGDVAVDLATDSPARRAQNFGAERGADLTPTMALEDDTLRGRPASDVSPFPESSPRVTSRVVGAVTRVTASSTGADPFGPAYAGPGTRPYLAVDPDRRTAWASEPLDPAPWLELTLAEPVAVLEVTLTGRSMARVVQAVRAEGGPGSVRVPVPGEGPVRLELPDPSRTWRITIERDGSWPVGIAWIGGLPGPTREVRDVPVGSSAGVVLQRMDAGRPACLDLGEDWACSPAWEVTAEESEQLRRTVPDPLPEEPPRVWVRPVPGPRLDALLDAASGLTVEASSAAFPHPSARAGAMFDADPATGWIPQPGDLQPQVDVTTAQVRTARTFRVDADARYEGLSATLVADGRVVARGVPAGRTVTFPPVSARTWRLVLATESDTPLPVRIRELELGWAEPGPVSTGCGAGLAVTAGQRTWSYRVTTSVARLTSGQPVAADPCPATGTVVTGEVRSRDLPWLQVERIAWLPDTPATEPVTVTALDPHTRRVVVPASTRPTTVVLAEGFSAGWQAELAGRPLEPVRLEGWRQGWRVPALAEPGVVTASFAPASAHRRGLAVGLVLAVLVVLAAAVAWRGVGERSEHVEGRGPEDPAGAGTRPGVAAGLTLVVGGALAGWAGLLVAGAALPLWRRGHRLTAWLAAGFVGGAGLVAVGSGDTLAGGSQLAAVAGLALAAGALAHAVEDRSLDGEER